MALLAVISACGFHSSDNGKTDGGTPDAAPTCFGSFVKVCFTTPEDVPTTTAMLPIDPTIEVDTDSMTMCDQHNDKKGNYCVIAGKGFTLPDVQSIRGYGSKPLVLLSTTTIVLQGTVDVSSNNNIGPKNKGANANPSACTAGTAAQGSSGGYGGSFGGKGGAGEGISPDAGGIAAPLLADLPTPLRGGCPGGNGGNGGGAGGDGGGAVAIVAGTEITVTGKINASGAGGHGGPQGKTGGGGGGSGGMIVLDAPPSSTVQGTGTLYANGGGGGEGGSGPSNSSAGNDGQVSADPTSPAAGGQGGSEGGNGGPGSAGTTLGGANAAGQSLGNGGGGAGGGGAGFVHAPGVTNIAPPSKNPL